MKNLKLQMMFAQLQTSKESGIEVLVQDDEMLLIGGSCPMLMSCGTYRDCPGKFKTGGGGCSPVCTLTIGI